MTRSQHLNKINNGRSKNAINLIPLLYKHWVYLRLHSEITPKMWFGALFVLYFVIFSSLVAFTIYPFFEVIVIAVLASIRLGSFQSIYYVLFSKYFPNRISVKTFKYILPLVSEFSFNCWRDLFQGVGLTSEVAVFSVHYRQERIIRVWDLYWWCGFILADVFL